MYLFGVIVVVVVVLAVIAVIGARRSASPTEALRPGEDVPDPARDAGHPDQPADWDPRQRYGPEDDDPPRPGRGAGPST